MHSNYPTPASTLDVEKNKLETPRLKGWAEIAKFLGQPVSAVQRWGRSGMPVTRSGRYITASPDELKEWLGKEGGLESPARFSGEGELAKDLKQSLLLAKRK